MVPIFLLMNTMAARRRLMAKAFLLPENLDGSCCRTCLGQENLEPIFTDKECEVMRSEDLFQVTGLRIKRNDGLSQKICKKCIEFMHTVLQFRKTSKKAEKTLHSMVFAKAQKRFAKKPVKLKVPDKQPKAEKQDSDYGYDYGDDFQNDDYSYMEQGKYENSSTSIKKELPLQKPFKKPGPATYKCNICDKEFRVKVTYNAHMRFHTSYSMCEVCGKRCRNNNQLQEHKRAKHGLGKIHKCAYCEYSSATKEALTIHERRHTGERPYVCDHCGAAFHRRSNLVQHIAIHLPEKNFQCDMCPKRLKSRKFLQIHKHNAHTGKRYGYLCPVCDHRFEKPNKVRAHIRRVHGLTDEQQGPICHICLKWEKSRRRLQSHIYRHQETKYRFICPVCKESFARPGNVRKHLVRTHNVPRDRQGRIEKYER